MFANAESERIHKKLMGELENFDNMVRAYGTADVYPVYRHQSAYSHTTGATADAFLIMDEGKLKFTTEPKGGEADITGETAVDPGGPAPGSSGNQPTARGQPNEVHHRQSHGRSWSPPHAPQPSTRPASVVSTSYSQPAAALAFPAQLTVCLTSPAWQTTGALRTCTALRPEPGVASPL
ncbi:hypothetical protein ABZ379_31720 [Streptomyces canus]|uniref:hypothetical protein n=1 Tax=Streptomyces canus TaxID=58343 RepID=UPI0033D90C2B